MEQEQKECDWAKCEKVETEVRKLYEKVEALIDSTIIKISLKYGVPEDELLELYTEFEKER